MVFNCVFGIVFRARRRLRETAEKNTLKGLSANLGGKRINNNLLSANAKSCNNVGQINIFNRT